MVGSVILSMVVLVMVILSTEEVGSVILSTGEDADFMDATKECVFDCVKFQKTNFVINYYKMIQDMS
jgi:hypothetical protein